MNAEIHAVDKEKRESEGQSLYVKGAKIELEVKREEGLAFGEHKDQHYLELRASSQDGGTHSVLTAKLNSDELDQIFDVALKARLIDRPVSKRVIELLQELHNELSR